MPRGFARTDRVGDQIQRELSALIRDELKDPRVGMVTLTGVEVSRDLAHARVYVTALGEAQAVQAAIAALNGAAGFLRRGLGQRMVLRSVPRLRFIHDESIDRGIRLSQLIEEAVAEDERRHRDEH